MDFSFLGVYNIGHEAHLGGAILGMLTAIAIVPEAIIKNFLPIVLALIPTLLFIVFVVLKPNFSSLGNPFKPVKKSQNVDDLYSEQKVMDQKEFDALLEKINRKGMDSLTEDEKRKLDDHSKKYGG